MGNTLYAFLRNRLWYWRAEKVREGFTVRDMLVSSHLTQSNTNTVATSQTMWPLGVHCRSFQKNSMIVEKHSSEQVVRGDKGLLSTDRDSTVEQQAWMVLCQASDKHDNWSFKGFDWACAVQKPKPGPSELYQIALNKEHMPGVACVLKLFNEHKHILHQSELHYPANRSNSKHHDYSFLMWVGCVWKWDQTRRFVELMRDEQMLSCRGWADSIHNPLWHRFSWCVTSRHGFPHPPINYKSSVASLSYLHTPKQIQPISRERERKESEQKAADQKLWQ